MSDFEELHRKLRAAQARMERAAREHEAGAADRDRAIAQEVARRGHGGATKVAQELHKSDQAISMAVRRGRRTHMRSLPLRALEILLAAEADTLPPLPARQWEALKAVVDNADVDDSWLDSPGEHLAQEVQNSSLLDDVQSEVLASTCQHLTLGQALAILDACLRDDAPAQTD